MYHLYELLKFLLTTQTTHQYLVFFRELFYNNYYEKSKINRLIFTLIKNNNTIFFQQWVIQSFSQKHTLKSCN